jgi:hypothetical protein
MKKITIRSIIAISLCVASLQLTGCKKKEVQTTNTETTTTAETPAPAPEPVTISLDEQLTHNLTDATKDFPMVTASVNNGEVTLSGSISRDRLAVLMESIHRLHPKKVNNNLTINK